MAKRPERSLGGFAGVRLGFRFSTELQTAARKTQPKRSQLGATLCFKVPATVLINVNDKTKYFVLPP